MKIEFTGRHIRVSERFKKLASARLNKLGPQLDEARKMISEVEETSDPGVLGGFYALIGETDRAFEFMSRAVDEGSLMMPLWLKSNPDFDSHRDDPRYHRLLERLKLPPDPPVTSLPE